MMNSISAPSEASTLLSLLQVLRDPALAEKKLADLMNATEQAKQAHDAATSQQLAAEARHKEAEKREAALAAQSNDVVARTDAVAKREREVTEREKVLHDAEQRLAANIASTTAALAKREDDVAIIEKRHAEMSAKIAEDTKVAADTRAMWEAKLKKLKEIAG